MVGCPLIGVQNVRKVTKQRERMTILCFFNSIRQKIDQNNAKE